jgi:hypothetical protein
MKWKMNSGQPWCEEGIGSSANFYVEIGHLVQNSSKVNGNGAKWKQLADRAVTDRRTLCKFLDGQALFTGLFHIYAATYKEMRDRLHPSSMESGQEDRDHWRALGDTVWPFWFHEMLGKSWVAERLVNSQDGLSSMELGIIRIRYELRKLGNIKTVDTVFGLKKGNAISWPAQRQFTY